MPFRVQKTILPKNKILSATGEEASRTSRYINCFYAKPSPSPSVSGMARLLRHACSPSMASEITSPVQRVPATMVIAQRVQVSLYVYIYIYICSQYSGGLSIYHNDTWTLWVVPVFTIWSHSVLPGEGGDALTAALSGDHPTLTYESLVRKPT